MNAGNILMWILLGILALMLVAFVVWIIIGIIGLIKLSIDDIKNR